MDGVVGRLQLFGSKGSKGEGSIGCTTAKVCTGVAAGVRAVRELRTTFLVRHPILRLPEGNDKGRVGDETS
jgi:hypothetical protein